MKLKLNQVFLCFNIWPLTKFKYLTSKLEPFIFKNYENARARISWNEDHNMEGWSCSSLGLTFYESSSINTSKNRIFILIVSSVMAEQIT